jgi:hypothetical protein
MKVAIALILLSLTAKAYGQQITSKDLVGIWDLQTTSQDNRANFSMRFIDSVNMCFQNRNTGELDRFSYSIDHRYLPNKIHFKKKVLNVIIERYHLLKLINGNTLKLQRVFAYNEPLKWQDDSTLAVKTQTFIKRK